MQIPEDEWGDIKDPHLIGHDKTAAMMHQLIKVMDALVKEYYRLYPEREKSQ